MPIRETSEYQLFDLLWYRPAFHLVISWKGCPDLDQVTVTMNRLLLCHSPARLSLSLCLCVFLLVSFVIILRRSSRCPQTQTILFKDNFWMETTIWRLASTEGETQTQKRFWQAQLVRSVWQHYGKEIKPFCCVFRLIAWSVSLCDQPSLAEGAVSLWYSQELGCCRWKV